MSGRDVQIYFNRRQLLPVSWGRGVGVGGSPACLPARPKITVTLQTSRDFFNKPATDEYQNIIKVKRGKFQWLWPNNLHDYTGFLFNPVKAVCTRLWPDRLLLQMHVLSSGMWVWYLALRRYSLSCCLKVVGAQRQETAAAASHLSFCFCKPLTSH